MNRLTVIIPSRNAENLAACINAVWQHEPALRIIVVDDGVDWLRYIDCNPQQVQTVMDNSIPGMKPFIFARNMNLGIAAAGTDDVILLNDDAVLQVYGGFTAMQRAAYENIGFGVIASTCNNVGNPDQRRRDSSTPLREELRTLCFVCVFIPRSTIDLVGLLDERFVDYGMDDDDYSLRVRQAGLKLGILDGCYVDHSSLTSSYRGPAGAGGDFLPNMKRFIEKHGVDNWNQGRETSYFQNLFPC